MTKLAYEHLKRHGQRHTGLTWMADAGVPLHSLRRIAGHGSIATTQRYLHPDRQSVADAGELLTRHSTSKGGRGLRVV
ncbi:MAG: tyrosine-type recombinase/integrase [Mycobacterium sp.]